MYRFGRCLPLLFWLQPSTFLLQKNYPATLSHVHSQLCNIDYGIKKYFKYKKNKLYPLVWHNLIFDGDCFCDDCQNMIHHVLIIVRTCYVNAIDHVLTIKYDHDRSWCDAIGILTIADDGQNTVKILHGPNIFFGGQQVFEVDQMMVKTWSIIVRTVKLWSKHGHWQS